MKPNGANVPNALTPETNNLVPISIITGTRIKRSNNNGAI